MKNEIITTANEDLKKSRANSTLVKSKRANAVKNIISEIIADSKAHKITMSSSDAIKTAIEEYEIIEADDYLKRAFKVAKAILTESYKMKKELLSLSTMEKLICFNVAQVNKLMNYDFEEYTDAVADLIDTAKVEKTVRIFSPKKAKAGK